MYFPHYIHSIMKFISFCLCVRVMCFFHFAFLGYWFGRHKESMFGICSVGSPPCSFGRTGKFDDYTFDSANMNDILAQVVLQISSLQIFSTWQCTEYLTVYFIVNRTTMSYFIWSCH